MQTGTHQQEIRIEVVKALGQACKSPDDYVAREALKELIEIKNQAFNTQTS